MCFRCAFGVEKRESAIESDEEKEEEEEEEREEWRSKKEGDEKNSNFTRIFLSLFFFKIFTLELSACVIAPI